MKQKRILLATGILLMAGLFLIRADASHAATLNVAAGADGLNSDSTCTLSEAIYNINNQDNSTYSECAAGDGNNDTIILPSGTITMSAQPEDIAANMTIEGQGVQNSIIDLDGEIGFGETGGGSEITFKDFTIFNPESWAARFVMSGSYEFLNLEITGNGIGEITGGAIAVEGDIWANGLYVHHLSGGQGSNMDVLDLDGDGGGEGLIENSTISHIQEVATAIGAVGFDNLTIRNTTIYNIGATDSNIPLTTGISGGHTSLALINNTIVGVYGLEISAGVIIGTESLDLFMQNNVIAGIDSGTFGPYTGGACLDLATGGISVSGGGNVVEDSSCNALFTGADHANIGSLVSTLGTLADNGGLVPTIALLEGSPAIDAGVTVAGLTADARGEVRPQGLAYDAGAYESPFTGNPGGDSTGNSSGSDNTDQAVLAQTGVNKLFGLLIGAFGVVGGAFILFGRRKLLV